MGRMSIPVRVRWADIDAYGHVNNAAVLTLLEEARIAAFWADSPVAGAPTPPEDDGTGSAVPSGTGGGRIDAGPGAGTATFIARQEVEYLAPLPYTMRPVRVAMWVSHLGGASIDVCYEVPGPDGAVAVRAMTTLVLVDPATGRPRRMTAEERDSWQPHVEDAVRFRRR